MNKENMEQVSFEELWSKLSGSTNFGQDELIEMLSYQDDQGEDFYIYHRRKAFCVPLHKIREFFTRHTKPVPPMTKDQELIYLRDKVKKLQDEAEQFQATGKVSRPAPDVPDKVLEAGEGEPEITGQDAPVVEEKAIPPKRDETIPLLDKRETMSRKEVQAMLAKELKGTKNVKEKVSGASVAKNIKDREGEVDALLKKK